jgi:hypothetical protein
MVVLEDLEATLFLHSVMLTVRPPTHHRLLISPSGQGEDPSFRLLAFEPLIVDESLNRFELRLEFFGEFEIFIPEEALRQAVQSKNEKEQLALIELVRTWTQAAEATSDSAIVFNYSPPEHRAS